MSEFPRWKNDVQKRIDALRQRLVKRELKRLMGAMVKEEKRKALTDKQS